MCAPHVDCYKIDNWRKLSRSLNCYVYEQKECDTPFGFPYLLFQFTEKYFKEKKIKNNILMNDV